MDRLRKIILGWWIFAGLILMMVLNNIEYKAGAFVFTMFSLLLLIETNPKQTNLKEDIQK